MEENSFYWPCKFCNARGTVNPNSPYARNPPNMTGEIIDRSISVCKKCLGCGIHWNMTRTNERTVV